jgi:hypothetical protein
LKLDESCISNPKLEISNWTVQSEISNFGFVILSAVCFGQSLSPSAAYSGLTNDATSALASNQQSAGRELRATAQVRSEQDCDLLDEVTSKWYTFAAMSRRLPLILFLFPSIAFAQTRAPNPASGGNQATASRQYATSAEAFAYVKAFINSLGWAKSGQSRVKSDLDQDFTEMLYSLKLANQDYEKGASAVATFSKSPARTILLSSIGTQKAFTALIDSHRKTISLVTSFLDGKEPRGAGTFADQLSDNMVQLADAWELLLTASIATTYVLLEPDPTNDRMQLNITAAQRDELAASLEKTFGANGLKDGLKAGQKPLEGAAAVLYSHLKQPWKTKAP